MMELLMKDAKQCKRKWSWLNLRYIPGGIEKYHEIYQSGYPVSEAKPGNSR
jgi:hypothetical protein